jgi:DNA-binding MarR family transcriptional regulator
VAHSAPTRGRAAGRAGSDESLSLWVRLLVCHNLMLSGVRRRMDARVVTMSRFDLLASLHREDGQALASLSRRLLVTAGNLTGLVDRAERDGVVVRRPDAADRRVARVHLTPKGRALIGELMPEHARHVREMLGSLTGAERRDLRRLLGRLRDGLITTHGSVEPTDTPAPRARRSTPRSRR